jgi:hypothetical protein
MGMGLSLVTENKELQKAVQINTIRAFREHNAEGGTA